MMMRAYLKSGQGFLLHEGQTFKGTLSSEPTTRSSPGSMWEPCLGTEDSSRESVFDFFEESSTASLAESSVLVRELDLKTAPKGIASALETLVDTGASSLLAFQKPNVSSMDVHKVGSVACRSSFAPKDHGFTKVQIQETSLPKSGDFVAVRVLTDHKSYNKLELTSGRLAKLNVGEVIIGALGARRALKGYVGDVPKSLKKGDKLHFLNMGGVMGVCTGFHHEMGQPIELEYLGHVSDGSQPWNMKDFALTPSLAGQNLGVPVVAVAGSCMHSGKTRAAGELVKRMSAMGLKVAAGKLSGVACLKDSHDMSDHGAVKTLSFVDLGLPSTVGVEDLGSVAITIITHLAQSTCRPKGTEAESMKGHQQTPPKVDVVIVELGDGILGGYHVGRIFEEPFVREHLAATVFCAQDFVSAWGGVELLKRWNIVPDVISGSVTDAQMGTEFIQNNLKVPAANAMLEGDELTRIVMGQVKAWRLQNGV